jgi:bacteriorhodopsin
MLYNSTIFLVILDFIEKVNFQGLALFSLIRLILRQLRGCH